VTSAFVSVRIRSESIPTHGRRGFVRPGRWPRSTRGGTRGLLRLRRRLRLRAGGASSCGPDTGRRPHPGGAASLRPDVGPFCFSIFFTKKELKSQETQNSKANLQGQFCLFIAKSTSLTALHTIGIKTLFDFK
jgi:hypothetical protein